VAALTVSITFLANSVALNTALGQRSGAPAMGLLQCDRAFHLGQKPGGGDIADRHRLLCRRDRQLRQPDQQPAGVGALILLTMVRSGIGKEEPGATQREAI
jgi:hypothetical protein